MSYLVSKKFELALSATVSVSKDRMSVPTSGQVVRMIRLPS